MIKELVSSPPTWALAAAAVFAITLVALLIVGPPSKVADERDFKRYLGACVRAGYTPERCLFADHYPKQALTLGGKP